jgi:carboxyl-terminal processing protease
VTALARRARLGWLALALLVPPGAPAQETPSSYGGIGAAIAIPMEGAGYPIVETLLPGGPASRTGIRVGDRLVGVVDARGALVDFRGKSLDEVLALSRGRSGSTLRLVVESGGSEERKLYELTRELISPPR